MTLRVIRQADLPKWFDAARYEAVTEFTLDEWLANLYHRYMALHGVGGSPYAQQHLKVIATDPLHLSKMSSFAPPPQQKKSPKPQFKTRTVQSKPAWWSAIDYVDMHVSQDRTVKALITAAFDELDSAGEEFEEFVKRDEPYDLLMKPSEPISQSHYQIVVTLHASDEEIKADFATWLDHARAVFRKPAPSKRLRQADIEKWATFMVLPYLDLQIWAKSVDSKIPYALMGKVLFPDAFDYDPTERVRRTTKPLADYLMQESVLEAFDPTTT